MQHNDGHVNKILGSGDRVSFYCINNVQLLADLIRGIPMDEESVIVFKHRTGSVRFVFPALITPDGNELNPRYTDKKKRRFPTDKQHFDYQVSRRIKIAKSITGKYRKDFR